MIGIRITPVKAILTFLAFLFIFQGCKKANIQFGEEFADVGYTNVVLLDTMTVELSTVHADSIVTSGSGVVVVGAYDDNVFGKISSNSFFPLAPPTIPEINGTPTFDSLVLRLLPNQTYYGDTTQFQQLEVHQLAERIAYGTGLGNLYSNSNFSIEPIPLGTQTVRIFPHSSAPISIRLSDEKGKQLLEMMKEKSTDLQTEDNFINFFKGLRVSSTSTQAVYGFADSGVVMRLYYRDNEALPVEKYSDFKLTSTNYQFNQINKDRTGTPTASFDGSVKEQSSLATGNQTFVQNVAGLSTKIRFPYLRNLLMIKDYVQIMKAILIIRPAKGSYSDQYRLPPFLQLSTTDASNVPGGAITTKTTGGEVTQMGDLQIDGVYGENTGYTYDITSYLTTQIAITYANQNGLLAQVPSPAFNTEMNRLVIGDRLNPDTKIQLNIYYASVAK